MKQRIRIPSLILPFLAYCTYIHNAPLSVQECLDRGLWEPAINHLKKNLEVNPKNVNALYHLAHTLQENRQPHEAIAVYKKVLELDPNHAHAHLGIGYCSLTIGDFKTGWPEFFWRSPNIKQFKQYNLKNQNLHNKIVLVRAEWGLGDMVQFVRFAQPLKNQGATIVVQAYEPLIPLLQTCPFIDKMIPTTQTLARCDYEIPLIDLAHTVDATLETIPQPPYLFADETLVKTWGKKLEDLAADTPHKPFRIGLCWHGKGDPNAPPALQKNIPLSVLAPLAELENIRFYSLQKMQGTEQCANAPFAIHEFGPDFDQTNGRFMDTAAVMKNLDLVLTIDTSIAHVAGALGVPTWVMLAHTTDWRWMLNRIDSPWYPTVKLFRQPNPGDWTSVVASIKQQLQTHVLEHLMTQAKEFYNKKKFRQAIPLLKKVQEHCPYNCAIMLMIANAYNNLAESADALTWYNRSLSIEEKNPIALTNAALALRRLGRHKKAQHFYEKALELAPEYENAYFGLGQTYLILGDFEKGLPTFERGRTGFFKNRNNFLTDISQIAGKRILIRPDWGLGDMIQFIRYAQLIQEHGGTVVVLPHNPLRDILATCPYIDQIVSREEYLHFDFQISPMSLPYIFQTTEKTIPQCIPYLHTNKSLEQHWRNKLSADPNFKIGICWEGSTTVLYPRKNVTLELFEPIAAIPGVSLYSLQKMNGTQQLENISFTVHHFGPDFDKKNGRFMDTAAVMKNLDLVLTVDTSIAHLAGALGVPVWVFLPYGPDWRWMLEREDTPWYPTMRLFRQKKIDEWSHPIANVVEALQKKVRSQ